MLVFVVSNGIGISQRVDPCAVLCYCTALLFLIAFVHQGALITLLRLVALVLVAFTTHVLKCFEHVYESNVLTEMSKMSKVNTTVVWMALVDYMLTNTTVSSASLSCRPSVPSVLRVHSGVGAR
eukprot:5616458-Amphidinium_carterae.1